MSHGGPAPATTEGALSDQRLEALARGLSASLPDTDPVSLALLGLLTAGRPVGRRDLVAAIGGTDPEGAVSAALRQMPGLEVDEEGRIVGYGLTLRPTDYQIVFTGPPLYAWSAFDTVLIPVMLGRPAAVRSHCQVTGIPVRCAVGPERLEEVAPGGAVISLVVPEPDSSGYDVRESFSRHVQFFASSAVAAPWQAERHLVRVGEAHAVARRIGALRAA